MPRTIADREAFARKAEAYYDEHLRAKLEPQHKGEFLILDPETGYYELHRSKTGAYETLVTNHSDAFFHIIRVGYRTVGRM